MTNLGSSHENSNVLAGFECPNCHSLEPFKISATSFFIVYDAGTDYHEDVEWELTSICICMVCGHTQTVADFLT